MEPQRFKAASAPVMALLGLVQLICMIEAAASIDACAVGCSSHGSCVEGFCECQSNWAGQDCSYFLESADGDAEDDLEADKCLDECSQRGVCLAGVCKCQKGWTGLSCNVAAQCAEDCNYPAGSCSTGSCVCAAGFFGPTCGDKKCPEDCFGHGICTSGSCNCSQGWAGRSCENKVDDASSCDPPCMSGSCVNGACYCAEGFSGPDCSLPVAAPTNSNIKPLTVQANAAQSNQSLSMVSALEKRLYSVEEELTELRQAKKESLSKPSTKGSGEAGKPKTEKTKKTNSLTEIHDTTAQSHHADQSLAQVVTSSKWERTESSSHTDHKSSWGIASLLNEGKGLIEKIETLTQQKLTSVKQMLEGSNKTATIPSSNKSQNVSKKTAALQAVSSKNGQHGAVATKTNVTELHKGASLNKAHHAATAANVAADRLKQIAQGSHGKQAALKDQIKSTIKHATVLAQKAIDDDEDSVALRNGKFEHKTKKAVLTAVATNTTTPCTCNGHGTCQADGSCVCEPSWVGLVCDMPRCPHDCNGRGMCVDGACVCEGGFYGRSCQHKRCMNDCSSQGFCFQGKCQCKAGFSGDSCEQFVDEGAVVNLKLVENSPKGAPPPIDVPRELSTLRKIPEVSCPSGCSKRGICHEGTCECFTGYSGPACQSFCPNECSHQGDCIEGACLCFAGFLGTDCSIKGCCNGHGTCDNPGECVCFPGWAGGDCSIMLMCPDPACSGHGKCKEGKCHCFPGFSGPICVPTGNCDPPCSPNGFCNPASQKCECKVGFTGPDCSGKVDECEDGCNGRGLCFNGNCMCGPGWDGHACQKRYMEPGQAPPAPKKDAAGGPAGDEAAGDDKGQSQIVAVAGGGAAAQAAAAAEAASVGLGPTCGEGGTCSGHGKCDTAAGKCDCDPGFDGVVCDIQHCEGWDGTLGSDCFGHGLCNAGACECAPGWGKDPNSANKTAPNVCKDQICAVGCGNYGMCVAGACVCQQGWEGPNCKDPSCGPTACSGHGQCTFTSPHAPAQCMCNYGWGGSQCQREALYSTMRKCANDCSGNGLCLDGKCICNVGFQGADCTEKVCADPSKTGPRCDLPRCYNDCTGKGLCMNGKCACWLGFSGVDCSIPSQCLEACGNVCEADTNAEKCKYCVGQCESVKDHYILGVHNPFDELETTLLQHDKQNATKLHHRHHKEISTSLLQTSPKHHHHEELYVKDLPIDTLSKHHHEVSVVSLPNSFF